MENHYNCIYLYINKINNKKYIGKTKNFNKRHRQHIDSSNNKNHVGFNYPIHRAIRRYGVENFDIIILKENLKTKCLMDLYECYYIKKYNTLTINNGYNVADGGQGANPFAGKSEEEINEIRKKQSDSKKGKYNGENNPNYNNHKLAGENNPMYGKCSEERRKNISKSRSSYLIDKIDKKTNDIIETKYLFEFGDDGFNRGHIVECCKGNRKSHKGFIFKYHKNTTE